MMNYIRRAMIISLQRGLLLFAVISLCSVNVQASDEHVQFLGNYSHITSATGEHCDGYDVSLWKYKGSLIGFLNHHRGLCGDPPMGLLQDVTYSAPSGLLSFKVKLSDGCTFQADKCLPTKDKVLFKGELQGETLTGVVTWHREDNKQFVRSEKITLARDAERSYGQSFKNYGAWLKYWEPILERRGPQW